ncbi:MAG: TonB-dependent receptor [Tannerellaceae bacterium]|nr:TonB-dependent receptor [Tannerellaceae bacterium]
MDVKEKYSINETDKSLPQILTDLFKGKNINYEVSDNTISVFKSNDSFVNTNLQEKRQITGTITDERGAPIIGANVMEKGTINGAITDLDGNFRLSVTKDAILQVSYIGYITQEVSVSKEDMLRVILREDMLGLEEIVVVGYGTQKKITVTGSIASASGKDITAVPTTNVSNTLVGRLPGLIAVNAKGEPGYDDANILIRGKSTTGDASPLIVVDGIADRAGSFNRIDPQDIESVTILKDASAAIYGSRAANGVILVTTKRGKEGAFRLNYSGNVGIANPTVIPQMAESWQYAQLLNEIDDLYGRSPRYTAEQIQKYKDGSDPVNYPNTDAFREVLNTALQTQHNLSFSGGNEKVRYYASLGYSHQGNNYKSSTSNYKQYNLRSNIDITPHQNFRVSVNLAGRQEDRNSPRSSSHDIWRILRKWYPTSSIVYPGTDYPVAQDGINPLTASDGSMGYQKSIRNYYNADITAHLEMPYILEGLSVDAGLYFDLSNYMYKNFATQFFFYNKIGEEYLPSAYGPTNASLTHEMDRTLGITLNARVNYERKFNNVHNVKVFAAYEQYTYRMDFLNGYREGFLSTSVDQLFAGDRNTANNNGEASEVARMNYFGRMDYDYAGKYLFQFNWRYDGSQNFPKGNRFGFFPGVSLGWRISEEDFWENNVESIDNLKLRASWGKMGNDKIDQFQYITSYTFANAVMLGGASPLPIQGVWQSRTPNPDITWEVATTYNIGLEATFRNSLNFSLDLFRSERNNILAKRNASLPAFTGLSLPDENFGECYSQGYEIAVDYIELIAKGLRLRLGGNFSHAVNEIKNIDEPVNVLEWQRRTGKPIDASGDGWLMYKADGIFRTQAEYDSYPHLPNANVGDIRFVDVNDDGVIDGNDRIRPTKTNVPEIIYGLNLGIDWNQWSLSTLWQGAGRVSTYQFFESGTIGNFTKDFYENRWTPENTDSRYPRTYNLAYTSSGQRNTFWLRNADYFRLKNIELSYSLSNKFLANSFIQGIRLYVSGYNLLTFTGLKNLDPEISSDTDLYAEAAETPPQKVINFGVNITF